MCFEALDMDARLFVGWYCGICSSAGDRETGEAYHRDCFYREIM